MKNKDERLIQGSLWKNMLLFGLPLIFSNLAQVFFNMSDLAVVGKFGAETALGEVGSTTTLVTLFTGFLIGLGNGVNVVVANYLGKKDYKNMKESEHTAFLLCLFIGLFILLVGMTLSKPLLLLLGTKTEFLEGASLYLKVYFIGMPALAIYNFGNAVYSAKGETKKPLIFLLVSGAVNVGLNFIFVLGCQLSVLGVALASVISLYLSATMVITSLLLDKSMVRFSFKDVRLYRGQSKQILGLGIPSGLQNAVFAIANLFIQSGVNSLSSTMVEGNAAAQNADALIYDTMAAFYMAGASFISQNYGANKKDRILKAYLISIVYSFGIAAILCTFLIVFGPQFLGFFTNKSEVVEAGMVRIMIMGFSYPFSAFMDATIAASRGLGKSFVPMIIVILGSCIFRIVWIYTIFAHFKTPESLYLLYIFSWAITATIELIYFILIYRRKMIEIDNNLCEQKELKMGE